MTIKLTDKEKIRIWNGRDIYKIMKSILLREEEIDQNREHFWVVGLEYNNTISFIELVSLGSYKSTVVQPMEVFSLALQKRAKRIILVHNHPSGTLTPSLGDKDITDRLIQTGLIVDTPVHDHLIISLDGYYSFLDNGIMTELEASLKYVAPYIQQERMKKAAKEVLIKKGADKAFKQMARKMKAEGLDNESIANFTGLDIETIKKMRVKKDK